MSVRGGTGWPALGVWLCLSVACTGAYDRPLPLEFVPGEFVAVQTESAVQLYRVEANGEFVARGIGSAVSEAAFDGKAGVVLWRLKAENVRWYDPELDDFLVPSVDDMLEELTVEAEDTCECPHLVFPTLIPLAPGASCPVPPEMASAFRWDGGEWTAVTGEPPGLFLRRSTSEVSCIEKVSLDDFIAGPNELPPEPRVISLEAYTATTGVMRGLLQHGQFLYVVGDRGWIVLDVESLEVRPEYGMWGSGVTVSAWSRASPGEALAVVSGAGEPAEIWAGRGADTSEAKFTFRTTRRDELLAEEPRFARSLGRGWFLVLERAGLRVYERDPAEVSQDPWFWKENGRALDCVECSDPGFESATPASFGVAVALSGALLLVPAAQESAGAPRVARTEVPPAYAWVGLEHGPARTLARRSGGRLALQQLAPLVAVGTRGGWSATLRPAEEAYVPETCAASDAGLMMLVLGRRVIVTSGGGAVWYQGGARCVSAGGNMGGSFGALADALVLLTPARGGARAILLDVHGRLVEFLGEPR